VTSVNEFSCPLEESTSLMAALIAATKSRPRAHAGAGQTHNAFERWVDSAELSAHLRRMSEAASPALPAGCFAAVKQSNGGGGGGNRDTGSGSGSGGGSSSRITAPRQVTIYLFDLSTEDHLLFGHDGRQSTHDGGGLVLSVQTKAPLKPTDVSCEQGPVLMNVKDASCATLSAVVESTWGVPPLGILRRSGDSGSGTDGEGGGGGGHVSRDFLWAHSDCDLALPFFQRDAPQRTFLLRQTALVVFFLEDVLVRCTEAGIMDVSRALLASSSASPPSFSKNRFEVEHAWQLATAALEKSARYLALNNMAQARESLNTAGVHARGFAHVVNGALDHARVTAATQCF